MFRQVRKTRKIENTMPAIVPGNGDEALFEVLGNNKKAKKRKIIRAVLIIVALLAIVLVVGISVLQRQVRKQFASSAQEVLRAKAERGTVRTLVSGSGTLANVDTQSVCVPAGVEVTEILVEYGDTVQTGDLLAVADLASVRTAMSDLQTEITTLDQQIRKAESDTVKSYISAGVTGRVKQVYAQNGMLVEDAMVEYGALAVLSLDGYMAVDLETDALKEGEAVVVVRADGAELTGRVERTVGKTATVLLTDNGPECDESVTVKTVSGKTIAKGTLYIHNPLKITGYAGTISAVYAKPNQQVYASSTLFVLKDTSTRANYDALLRSRGEKEETLLELLKIQRYGGLTAPISGSVYSVADLDSEDEEEEITDIVVLSPDVQMSVTISVDESDILALQLEQQADVTVSSVSDETLSGVVTEIDKTDSGGAYTAVILLDKVKGMIPGMTASVDVRIEGVDDAIVIPVDALHQTSAGYYVYTQYDEETKTYGGKVDVVPGLRNSSSVEIKSGLNVGDTVYYTKVQKNNNPFGTNFGGMPGGPGMGGNSGGKNNGGRQNGSIPSGNFGGGMPGGMPSGRG